jgi:hypothetical protein
VENKPTAIERAFQLARSGNCHSVEDIRRALTAECFSSVGSHMSGSSLLKQLRAEMARCSREDVQSPVQIR